MNIIQYPNIKASLEEIEYWDVHPRKELYSAIQTEHLMKANNLGAALFAAKYLHKIGGHLPELLYMVFHKGSNPESLSNVVALYETDAGFRTMGKTNTLLMVSNLTPYESRAKLADAYAQDLVHHGFNPHSWSPISLDKIPSYDWRRGKGNLSSMHGELGRIHGLTKKDFTHKIM